MALPTAPVSLDPHLQDERATLATLAHVFEALTTFDGSMRLRPMLAASWENPSDTLWRFRLRPDVAFHDGRTLSADDVVASLERARTHPASQVAGFLVSVRSVRRIDATTVEIETEEPAPLLAARLSFVAIVPAAMPGRIEAPIGTGPWRFSSWNGTRLELEAFDEHRLGPSAWSGVDIDFVESEAERLDGVLGGRYDIAAMVPNATIEGSATARLRIERRAGLAVTFLGMRVDRPPFDDLALRRALDTAIDREALVRETLPGPARPAYQPTSPAVFGHAIGLAPRPHDPAAARAALARLELDAPLALMHPPGLEAEAAALVRDLEEVGLPIEARVLPWPELYQQLSAGTVDLFLAGYACDSGSASDLFDAALHTRDAARGYGNTNFMGYSNATFDALVERANATLDERSRRAMLEDASRIVLEDLPIIPLWINESVYAVRESLEWQPRLDRRVLAHEVSTRSGGE